MTAIPPDTSVKEFLTVIMPEMVKKEIVARGAAEELTGTQMNLVVDISGEKYSYDIKDGIQIEVGSGDLPDPVVRMNISKDDMARMIASGDLEMITGMMTDMNKTKYETLKRLKGSFEAVLSNEDGSVYRINVVINGAEAPKSTFKMSTANSAALMKKETNPVNLFMSGAMQIEGDMAFAMATQPLFS